MFDIARHPVKESGTLIFVPLEGGPSIANATVQCVHCGRHWIYQPGSGRRRGFCARCNGITCGKDACMKCVPQEVWCENIEAGRPADYRRIIASGGFGG